jgi:serine/threonine protein kinase
MPLSPNSEYLVNTLQALPLLAGRFANLKIANYDSVADQRRGSFSLVFRADDVIDGRPVALKFYDIDPRWTADTYRRACFARESEILQQLESSERCLQLVQANTVYELQVPAGSGVTLTIPCSYFAVEWLDGEIDEFFLEQQRFPSLEKLRLFYEVILAVEALHRHGVFHRDLKADNLRRQSHGPHRSIVAIDLGTAAKFDSGPIASAYGIHVGALWYAAPEARCGLSGNRLVARSNDVYALGCLLFELFNPDYFFHALTARNPGFDARLAALAMAIPAMGTDGDKLSALNSQLAKASHGVTPIVIDGSGSSVDPAISTLLNELLTAMTHFDYRRRPTLETIRNRTRIALTVLRNESAYQKQLERKRHWRQQRLQKIADQRARSQARVCAPQGEKLD